MEQRTTCFSTSQSRIAQIVIVGTFALMAAASSLGQSDRTKNAATWYERAMAGMNRFTPEEILAIETYAKSPGAAPSPEVRALIDRASPLVDNILHASAQGYSDFGLDYSQGLDMKLHHLGKMRMLARIV